MKVLSWNILANEYIQKKYYPNVQEELLIRKERFKIIIDKLLKINADIILLQEVMKAEYKNLINLLSQKYYISPLIPIQWIGYEPGESGNVTLIKLSKFNKINFKTIDSFNYIKCQHRNTQIYIVNIHLDDSSQERRIKQINNILDNLKDKDKIIIGGDYNEEYKKGENIYKLLKDNNFKISIEDFTYFIEKQMNIDNIFYKNFELKESSVNNICGKRTIQNINCQLENYGSDHFPIIIKLKL
jgi:endonuclease/exonuclease/phosphatase family metal-dependent hydrolase